MAGAAALSIWDIHLAMMVGTAFFLAYVSKGMRRYRIPQQRGESRDQSD
ncbi:MAG: hypothetical protein ACFE0I_03065 [Elainellaceae cyanobacterium]